VFLYIAVHDDTKITNDQIIENGNIYLLAPADGPHSGY